MVTVQHHSDISFDATTAWAAALKTAELNGDNEIFFPRGEYHFYRETKLKHCFVSNNDESIKRIVFYLACRKNLKIRGDEAKFIFHGRLLPFVIEESQNISITGISIDFSKAFHFEAKLVDSDENSSLLRIPEEWSIENGKLLVFNDGLDAITGKFITTPFIPETGDFLEFGSYQITNQNLICEKENELLRVPVKINPAHTDLYLRHQGRHTPAFLIDRSDDTSLENIIIHHAEGMAVVGQNSRNIILDHISVIPAENRTLSVTDDAIHLSECEGRIEIKNCVFLNTIDDAINVHGMYRRLKKSNPHMLMEACHFQQFGLWNGRPGDVLELLKADTMKPYGQVRCKECLPGTRQLYCLLLEDELPPEYESGDIVRFMRSADMEVVISNNRMSNNLSRGILLSGAKRGLIENNTIHAPGNGIYISGDANYWYESGPVENVEIRNNIFDHCAYTQKNAVPINFDPVIPKKVPGFYYHGKANIHDNVFRTKDSALVMKALSVAEINFHNNTIVTDEKPEKCDFVSVECGKLSASDNLLNGNNLENL